MQLQHVSALQGHLQATVHQLKLPHCTSSYVSVSHAIEIYNSIVCVERPKHVAIECDFNGTLK
jgi:hypothetical protein